MTSNIEGVGGWLRTGVVVEFNIIGNEVSQNWGERKNLIRGSKSFEQGTMITFDAEVIDFNVKFSNLVHKIGLYATPNKAKPLTKVFCKVPDSENCHISEFFVTGHFEVNKIHLESQKKTISGDQFNKKFSETKRVAINDSLFILEVGPPLLQEVVIESAIGRITTVKQSLDVEI